MRLIAGLFVLISVLSMATAGVGQEAWTVTLTSKQSKQLAGLAAEDSITAFAISPDGPWGRSWGYDSKAQAELNAMRYCRENLRRRDRDCLIYQSDGQRVVPDVVQTRRVSEVYKPLNGRKAASVFGRVAFSFQGDAGAARAQLATAPTRRADLTEDRALRKVLTGRTLMTTKAKGFAVTFEDVWAEHSASANSGIITVFFDSWTVTSSGLVCMFDGYWESTRKPVGTRCMVLNAAGNGLVDMSWDNRPNASVKGQLIAGDARFAAVK